MIRDNLKSNLKKKESLTLRTVKSSLWVVGSTGFLSVSKIIFVFIFSSIIKT